MIGDRVSGVRLADGTQYAADMVVNCAGRWTNEAVREAGCTCRSRRRSASWSLPAVAAGLNRVVRTP